MIKEQCEHCHNMVVGQFSPSDTRKWLTALAKKGGMKAVMTAAGSAVGGIGAIPGLLVGTAVDVIYGKDINKLVDKVADAFDDSKIYVFTCPNCGHTWTRKEDDVLYGQVYDDFEENENEPDEMASEFDQSLTYFLDNETQITQSAESVSVFMAQMTESGRKSSEQTRAAFHFLAALAGLFFLKDSDSDTDDNRHIQRQSVSQIRQAVSLRNSDEYRLIEILLQIQTAKSVNELPKLIRKAVAYKIDEDYSWLKKNYYQKSLVPDVCFWKVNEMNTSNAISNEDRIALWKPLVNSPEKDYRMYANLQIYWKLSDSADESAYSFLSEAFNTKGFSINKPDMENVMYEKWLWAAEEYAECLCSGISNTIGADKHRGLDIMQTIGDLGTLKPCLCARHYLGEQAESEGNLQQALTYYIKAGEIGSDGAMRVRKILSLSNNDSNSTDLTANKSKTSDVEDEYICEFKACLEEGGEISKGERRLLEKLRIKLGISKERAAELEQLLLTPELTEEEQEYLAEYKECLAEDGIISAGERRLLNRLRDKLGISEERAKELEK